MNPRVIHAAPVARTRSVVPVLRQCRFVVPVLAGLVAALLPAGPAGATEPLAMGPQLDAIFDDPMWSNARWGVKVIDLDSSTVLYGRDVEKGFAPASNMKIYTTAAALEILGPDHRFATRIYATGPVRDGVLRGDLLVVGSGDPSISGRYETDTQTTAILGEWADAVRRAGIRRVEGAVIGDDDVFDESHVAGSWQLDYYQAWYAAENSGLAINENCYDVLIRPGAKPGDKARLALQIPTRYITLRNEVVTTGPAGRRGGDPPIEFERTLEGNVVTVKGAIPSDLPEHRVWGGVRNGTLYTATLLAEELARRGVRVRGGAVDIDDVADKDARRAEAERRLLHTHISPPMSRLVAIVNKPSQNFYADQLLKVVGAAGSGRGSFRSGERAVKDMLTTAGLDASGLVMADGSGLSRQNMVEPRMTAGLLAWAAGRPWFDAFHESLPIGGVDGTLRTRMKNTVADGKVRAKTGFIGRVRALSGYTTSTVTGKRLAFSMMANNYMPPTSTVNDAQDTACVVMITARPE